METIRILMETIKNLMEYNINGEFMITKNMMEKKVSLFFDREKELKKLHENVLSLKNKTPKHSIIQGFRRMGKTHLIIKHILKEWDKKTIPIYLDMLYFTSWIEVSDAIVNSFMENYDETNKKNLKILLEKAKQSIKGAIGNINEIETTFGTAGKEFISVKLSLTKKSNEMEMLKSAVRFISSFCEKNDIYCILCFDEIQNIKEFDRKISGLAILRGELQFQNRINLIMTGSLPSFIKQQFIMKNKPFWKQLTIYSISPFEKESIKEILKNLKLDTKNSEKIYKLSKGIPDYVIKMINKLKRKMSIEEAFLSIVEDEKEFTDAVLSSLNNTQLKIVKEIAFGKNRYLELENKLTYPPTAVLNSLEFEGIIQKIEKGKYEIVDPILEYYLKISKI